jgi:multiple sugar transport system permease protein
MSEPIAVLQKRDRTGLAYSLFFLVAAVAFLIPALGVVYTSLRTDADIAASGVWTFSANLTFENFVNAFSSESLLLYLRNSFLVTIPATLGSVALGTMSGYVLAKLKPRGSNFLLVFFVAALFVPPQILLIPLFQLFNLIGLYNTIWPMIIVHTAFGISLCTLVMRNFFLNVPNEIIEAASIDGASIGRTLTSVVLPLSRPALAALATLQFTFIWNDFLYPLIFTRTDQAQTIMVGLLNLQGQYSTAYGAQAALSVIASVPTVLVFLFFQKQFIAGLTTGAVKG